MRTRSTTWGTRSASQGIRRRRSPCSSVGWRFPISAPRWRLSWRARGRTPARADRDSGRPASERARRTGARHCRQPKDAQVADGGREVADVAAHEAEGDAGVRIAPAAAATEAVVAEGAGSAAAEPEGVVEAESPAHADAENPVHATSLDPSEPLDCLR